MRSAQIGLLVGVVLGFALVFGSFGDMLIVALIGAVGFLIGKAVDGDLDVSRYLGSRQDR